MILHTQTMEWHEYQTKVFGWFPFDLKVLVQTNKYSDVKYWIEGTFYWPKNSKKCTEYVPWNSSRG